MSKKLWYALAIASLMAAFGASEALAQSAGQCEANQGVACTSNAQCPASGSTAMLCVDGSCQPSCDTGSGQPKNALCSLGETCVSGSSPGVGTRYYCKPSPFSLDLNLLDTCIAHFLDGVQPDTTSGSACSLSRNLANMLEQDGAAGFTIYDVDLCVKKFLQDPGCSTATQSCPNGEKYCAADSACGEGLFCNMDLHRCERQCGLITNRDQNSLDTLDRKCSGTMEVCDFTRGKCESLLENAETCQTDGECGQGRSCVSHVCQPGGLPPELTCSIDQDCPSGAYCFIGQCVPRCYRSLDCPDSNWYCGSANTCLPKPRDPSAAAGFNPKEYSIGFGFSEVNLDPIQDRADVPLVILNTTTKKEVFGQPNVVFGYRLELTYGRKQEAKCQADPIAADDRADCLITADREFIVLKNPFGTIYGTGDAAIGIGLNSGALSKLTPGYYQVTLKAIFNNGRTASTTLRFRQPSPSGDYVGRMSVMSGSLDAANRPIPLGNSNVSTRLFVNTKAAKVEWDTLLAQNNLDLENEFRDVTRGFPINATIHANDSMLFSKPGASTPAGNEIPLKGIYADHLGKMRLIGVIDIEADYCRSENGTCTSGSTTELQIRNAFGRKIRRIIEFIGPYNPQTREFRGVYRETISGLAPWDVTLDGGFELKQTVQNDAPFTLGVLAPTSTTVGFPSNASLTAPLDADRNNQDDVTQYCPSDVAANFASQAAFDAFMAAFDTTPTFGGTCDGNNPNCSGLVQFETLITNALNTLNNNQNKLTLSDYFKGEIPFCATPGQRNCVDESKLRCGLSGFRKAVLKGWIDGNNVQPIEMVGGGYTAPSLFCTGVPGSTGNDTCPTKAALQSDLVALQEHNRFYKELTQTYTYEAGGELSDAFYVLFKAASGQPLESATAYAHKELNLRNAMFKYDSVRREVLSPASTAVLFAWPMSSFKNEGEEWIQQLHTVFSDRMDALIELVDLRRRVLTSNPTRDDFTYLKHVMQQEWLQQVFLAVLEHHWQGENFSYAGYGTKLLEQGDTVLAKANDTRNPLGLHPNRIYFENADLTVTNWQNFKGRVQSRLAQLQNQSSAVLAEMRGALQNKDTLIGKLALTQQELDASLNELCGQAVNLPAACTVDRSDKEFATSCRGPGCTMEYQCDGSECDKVVEVFNNANDEVSCRKDSRTYKITVNGAERLCVRGRMGALMQESVSLELARKQAINKVQSLLRQIARQQAYMRETEKANGDLVAFTWRQGEALNLIEAGLMEAQEVYEQGMNAAEIVDCFVIAGTASGTNCAQKAVAQGLKAAAITTNHFVTDKLQATRSQLQLLKEVTYLESQQTSELRGMRMQLDNLVTDVENYVAEYEAVTQQLFNLNVQLGDTHFLAKQAAERYSENVNQVVNRLIGRESGNALLRNSMVQEFNAEFQKLLIDTYKMTQAFIHRYNFAESAGEITNQVYQLQTLADVQSYVNQLANQEQNYCGAAGIDCDSANNRETLEFSVRKELFPEMRDIVDPATGKVLTAGQQFHNMITSAAYLKRRNRAIGIRTQVELPFAVWMQNRGSTGSAPQPWMVTPNECNHIVAADRNGQAGTIAVNVIGTNLSSAQASTVKYELVRGDTDYIRSCTERASLASGERKINTFTVGWAPSNPAGSLATPPAFEVQSAEFTACKNNVQLADPATRDSQTSCFKYFARDRSLGAPDWKFVLPNLDDSQAWLLGNGVPEGQKPIIEDIVLYVRYSARSFN